MKPEDPWFYGIKKDNQIVASVGRFPVRMKIKERTFDACWLVDLLVHPHYQGIGLGYLLTQEFINKEGFVISQGETDASFRLLKSMHTSVIGKLYFLRKYYSIYNTKWSPHKENKELKEKTGSFQQVKVTCSLFKEINVWHPLKN